MQDRHNSEDDRRLSFCDVVAYRDKKKRKEAEVPSWEMKLDTCLNSSGQKNKTTGLH